MEQEQVFPERKVFLSLKPVLLQEEALKKRTLPLPTEMHALFGLLWQRALSIKKIIKNLHKVEKEFYHQLLEENNVKKEFLLFSEPVTRREL